MVARRGAGARFGKFGGWQVCVSSPRLRGLTPRSPSGEWIGRSVACVGEAGAAGLESNLTRPMAGGRVGRTTTCVVQASYSCDRDRQCRCRSSHPNSLYERRCFYSDRHHFFPVCTL
jgi:hypothetical protein